MSKTITSLSLALLVFFLALSTSISVQGQGTTRYLYDDNGRLQVVVTPNGDAALYSYDPAGNIKGITRASDPNAPVKITSLSPGNGVVGLTITITGIGFSSTATQNLVSINGSPAEVNTATSTQLTVTIPLSATSGYVTVVTPTGIAVGSTIFGVIPEILSFTPIAGVPGTNITIQVKGFGDDTPTNNEVQINQKVSLVTSATARTILAQVPPFIPAGKVRVTNSAGTALSTNEFFSIPSTYTGSTIASAERITIGTSKDIPYSSPSISVVVFEGTAGQRIGVQTSTFTDGGLLTIHNPDGSVLLPTAALAGTINPANNVKYQVLQSPITLPTTGTYTMVFTNLGFGYSGGSISLDVYTVPTDSMTALAFNAPAVTQTTTLPGQVLIGTFTGTAGQRVGVRLSGLTDAYNRLVWFDPAQNILAYNFLESSETDYWEVSSLPTNGVYTIQGQASYPNTGAFSYEIFNAPDVTGIIATDGTPTTFSTTIPSQNLQLAFSGTTSQALNLRVTSSGVNSSPVLDAQIKASDGSVIWSATIIGTGQAVTLPSLPTNGAYSLCIDPRKDATGNFIVELGSNLNTNPTLNIGGPDIVVTGAAGEIKDFAINATGQTFALKFRDISVPAPGPSTPIASPVAGDNPNRDRSVAETGSTRATTSRNTTTGRGANIRPGTEGGVFVPPSSLSVLVYNPDSNPVFLNGYTPGEIGYVTIDTYPGTYHVNLFQEGNQTYQTTLGLYAVPTGATRIWTGNQTPTISVGSQPIWLFFNNSYLYALNSSFSGGDFTVNLSNNTAGSVKVELLEPDGTVVETLISSDSSFTLPAHYLNGTDMRLIRVTATGSNTGTIRVGVTEVPPSGARREPGTVKGNN